MKSITILIIVLGLVSIAFQDTERYQQVKPNFAKFEDENYLDSLQVFNNEIAILFQKFAEVAEKEVSNNERRYKIWYREEYCSFGITVNPITWVENLSCRIHNKDRMGHEAVSPKFIIRDTKLGIDYYFYLGSYKSLSKESLIQILENTFLIDLEYY